MPGFADHESGKLAKILCVADSGSGKTGATASLVNAGYNVRFIDFDNGLSVLRGFAKPEMLKNVHYVTLRDSFTLKGDKMGIKKANAYQRAMDTLEKGGDLWGEGSDIPPLTDWTEKDWLVIDSLGLMGRSCLLMVMQANGAIAKAPEIQHYGTAMENIERFVAMITSGSIGCNVLVNTHVYIPDGSTRPAPDALGSKLGPKIPKYFDNMISIRVMGKKREFCTQFDGPMALKTAVPLQPNYPIDTGLLTISNALMGKKP